MWLFVSTMKHHIFWTAYSFLCSSHPSHLSPHNPLSWQQQQTIVVWSPIHSMFPHHHTDISHTRIHQITWSMKLNQAPNSLDTMSWQLACKLEDKSGETVWLPAILAHKNSWGLASLTKRATGHDQETAVVNIDSDVNLGAYLLKTVPHPVLKLALCIPQAVK